MLDDVDVFAGHLAVTERVAGSLQLRIVDLASGDDAHDRLRRAGLQRPHRRQRRVRDDDPALRLHLADDAGVDLRLRPGDARARAAGSASRCPATTRRCTRASASSRVAGDGTEVPISLVYRARPQARRRRSRSSSTATAATASRSTPRFSQSRVSLLDRGVVFAIAHIRGGGDLGRSWYEAGKMASKQTTFDDFIACAEALIAAGRTTPALLAIEGGSAGGLLMGAVVNQRPELFRAVVAAGALRRRRRRRCSTRRCRSPSASSSSGATRRSPSSTPGCAPTARTTTCKPGALPGDARPHRPQRHARSRTGSRPSTSPGCAR